MTSNETPQQPGLMILSEQFGDVPMSARDFRFLLSAAMVGLEGLQGEADADRLYETVAVMAKAMDKAAA